MKKISDEQIILAATTNTSMEAAAKSLNMRPAHFRCRALKLGVYVSNQGRKGKPRDPLESANNRIPLNEILNGMCPQYNTRKLKFRLFEEKIKPEKCENCGNNKFLTLHHEDGDHSNHTLNNLKILCYNCHSNTDNFAGKNKNKKEPTYVGDKMILELIHLNKSNKDITNNLNIISNGANYRRIDRLRVLYNYIINLP